MPKKPTGQEDGPDVVSVTVRYPRQTHDDLTERMAIEERSFNAIAVRAARGYVNEARFLGVHVDKVFTDALRKAGQEATKCTCGAQGKDHTARCAKKLVEIAVVVLEARLPLGEQSSAGVSIPADRKGGR